MFIQTVTIKISFILFFTKKNSTAKTKLPSHAVFCKNHSHNPYVTAIFIPYQSACVFHAPGVTLRFLPIFCPIKINDVCIYSRRHGQSCFLFFPHIVYSALFVYLQ